jgi:hypothetical protein
MFPAAAAAAAAAAGSIPVSLGSLRGLQFINLANNRLGGALPGLPPGLKLLNIRWGPAVAAAGSSCLGL